MLGSSVCTLLLLKTFEAVILIESVNNLLYEEFGS